MADVAPHEEPGVLSHGELTDEIINEMMLRAEKAFCPLGDQRCDGSPYDVASAVQRRTPAGWCKIGNPGAAQRPGAAHLSEHRAQG
jgi:hypothetical protein